MGAIAEAFVAYAQPLLDACDGSDEQVNRAFQLAQLCYNIALLPHAEREKAISEMRSAMNDEDFTAFRDQIVLPMVARHHEMFAGLNRGFQVTAAESAGSPHAHLQAQTSHEPYPGTDRYARCPCNSGEKYKFCCGKKRR